MIGSYEAVGKALTADDLEGAKKAAAGMAEKATAEGQPELAKDAEAINKAENIESARTSYKSASTKAIDLVKGQPGYYVMTCSMAKADWVQTTRHVANPFMGKRMPECGIIKK